MRKQNLKSISAPSFNNSIQTTEEGTFFSLAFISSQFHVNASVADIKMKKAFENVPSLDQAAIKARSSMIQSSLGILDSTYWLSEQEVIASAEQFNITYLPSFIQTASSYEAANARINAISADTSTELKIATLQLELATARQTIADYDKELEDAIVLKTKFAQNPNQNAEFTVRSEMKEEFFPEISLSSMNAVWMYYRGLTRPWAFGNTTKTVFCTESIDEVREKFLEEVIFVRATDKSLVCDHPLFAGNPDTMIVKYDRANPDFLKKAEEAGLIEIDGEDIYIN